MIKMNIKMMLLSDAIFGNGSSIPGAEDISILCDGNGFPYYKGGTFKGIFREELGRYLELCGKSETEIRKIVTELLGMGLSDDDHEQIIFSDFTISGLPIPISSRIVFLAAGAILKLRKMEWRQEGL